MTKIYISAFLLILSMNIMADSNQTDIDTKKSNANNYITHIIKEYANQSLNEIIARFGEPTKVEIEKADNQYSTIDDDIYTIIYDSHEVMIKKINHLNEWLFISLKLKKKGIYSNYGIDIGVNKEEVEELFGVKYMNMKTIDFVIENNALKEITIYNLE